VDALSTCYSRTQKEKKKNTTKFLDLAYWTNQVDPLSLIFHFTHTTSTFWFSSSTQTTADSDYDST